MDEYCQTTSVKVSSRRDKAVDGKINSKDINILDWLGNLDSNQD